MGGAKWGLIDKQGKMVLPPISDDYLTVKEGCAIIVSREKNAPNAYYFIEVPSGNKISELRFHFARDFCEGFAAVCIDEKWGFIDRSGKIICEPKFDSVYSFKNGLALVCEQELYGWINTNGIVVVLVQRELDFAESCLRECCFSIRPSILFFDFTSSG